jgi:ABC-2 type transport system permease protein
MPARGNIWAFFLLTFLFSLCQTTFGYMMGKFIGDKVFASQVTCILLTPSTILGGYTYPLMAMPKAFQILSYAIPYTQYAESVRAMSLKNVNFMVFLPQMRYLLIVLFVELLILFALLRLFSALRKMHKPEAHQVSPALTAGESEVTAV